MSRGERYQIRARILMLYRYMSVVTLFVEAREVPTGNTSTYRVGIDPARVNLTIHSDAVHAVRSSQGFWDHEVYHVRVLRLASIWDTPKTMNHEEVVELP